ncbi:MAG: RdgB/HAM1 family non-canonical purine NTP pyrophosphatase [Pelagibacteraceae bacterium]|jgi:XTP/dITP diphosphohydrolase|nr:RdgB/HAM1 family non-canonical purine NTP pyrophosphatase [Pelagibacteraceae bacterium]
MKKIEQILIGTHNKGKIKEICYLLNKKIKKITPLELQIKSPSETGKSFKANSELKAKYFFNKSKIITLSDDSGLCIDCLNNQPGIYSARWAKKYGNFNQAGKKILDLIKKKNRNKKIKNVKAKFICSLSFCYKNNKIITAEGIIEGKISDRPKGKNGFGYDPIFIPKGTKKTFGQMSKKKKMLMDHRFLAFKKMKKKINIL